MSPAVVDRLVGAMLQATALIAATIVLLIAAFVTRESWPALRDVGLLRFWNDSAWQPTAGIEAQYRVLPMLAGSLLVTLGSLLLAAPWGIFIALFESYFAPRSVAVLVRRVIELLNGVPSVVFGFWGLVVLVPLIGRWKAPGASLLAGSVVLALMVLPTVAMTVRAALQAVPASYFRSAAATGLSRWSTIWNIALPTAQRGIVTGLVLAFARAIGETMAVVMVCGNIVQVPRSVFAPVRTITANIALEMGYATESHRAALFVTGLLLMVLVGGAFAVAHLPNAWLDVLTRIVKSVWLLRRAGRQPTVSHQPPHETPPSLPQRFLGFCTTKSVTGGVTTIGRDICVRPSFMRQTRLSVLLAVGACWMAAGSLLACFAWLLLDVVGRALGQLSWSYLIGSPTDFGRSGGIGSILVSTGLILLVSLVAAIPVGLGTAAWLAEFTSSRRPLARGVRFSVDLLASVPSILFGLFGMVFFCQTLKMGFSILAGGLTLALMILPIIVGTTYSGLRSVSDEIRVGAAALGLCRVSLLRHLLLPAAMQGVVVGAVLGIGRALAETAALIFTSGYVTRMPESLFDSGRTLSVHIYDLSMNVAGGRDRASAAAFTLLVALLWLNVGARRLSRRFLETSS